MDERFRKYKIFDPVIQSLNSLFINPSNDIVDECKRSFTDFFFHFQKNLSKHNQVINSYRKTLYTGSYSDHLQIGNMYKEFNGAILIHLPKDSFEIEPSSPGHVNITFDMPKNISSYIHQTFKSWLDHENYIIPNKFRSWGESIITKSFNDLDRIGSERILKGTDGDYLFSMSKSDPSFTMHVEKIGTNIKFDVDILLCLEFVDYWPDSFNNLDRDICNEEWLAEPKEPNNYPNQRGWRYTFPRAEKEAIVNCQHMKSTIRLIKKLRDLHKMPYLTSYLIKTIFLWETDNYGTNYWQQSLGCLMVNAITKIQSALETQDISFYWDDRLNLWHTLKLTQIEDCQRKLNKIMQNIQLYCIQNNPEMIINILLTSDEKIAYRDNINLDSHPEIPGTSLQNDQVGILNTIQPETIAAGIGVAAAAVIGGFMLFRSFRNQND